MAAQHVNADQFDQVVIKSEKPVMVDFYADWCGPCKLAEPVLNSLSEEYKDKVTIVKVDVDENNELAGKYGVMSIPTVILFKNGEEADRLIGYSGEQGYRKILETHS